MERRDNQIYLDQMHPNQDEISDPELELDESQLNPKFLNTGKLTNRQELKVVALSPPPPFSTQIVQLT